MERQKIFCRVPPHTLGNFFFILPSAPIKSTQQRPFAEKNFAERTLPSAKGSLPSVKTLGKAAASSSVASIPIYCSLLQNLPLSVVSGGLECKMTIIFPQLLFALGKTYASLRAKGVWELEISTPLTELSFFNSLEYCKFKKSAPHFYPHGKILP